MMNRLFRPSWHRLVAASLLALAVSIAAVADAAAQATCASGNAPQIVRRGVRPNALLNYHFAPSVPSTYRDGVRDAFAKWALANSFSKLGVVYAEGSGGVEVTMDYLGNGVGASWDATNATYDGDGFVTAGTLTLTYNTQWLDSRAGAQYFTQHEIGHVHGLWHDNNRHDGSSVMNGAVGKNDSGGGTRHKGPSICDATQAAAARLQPVFGGGISFVCPMPGGCAPNFPPPCNAYSPADAWCYPSGPPNFTPENFPDTPAPTSYTTPLIAITDPPNGATLSGSSATFSVGSIDTDGRVMFVNYLVNGQVVFSSYQWPYTWTVSLAGVAPGSYAVSAIAYDNQMQASSPSSITVTVPGGGGGGGNPGTTLAPWQRLYAGQALYSPNGQFYLVHQVSDGHLVEYQYQGGSSWAPVWATGFTIAGGGGYTEMDGYSGNLVSYPPSGWPPYWAANPPVSSNSYLQIHNDGTIKIYSSGGAVLCTVTNIPWQWGGSCP